MTGTGIISIVREVPILEERNGQMTTQISVVAQSAGTVNYTNGEIIINPLNIISTSLPQDIIEIQAFPESNDIIGLKDLYLSFNIEKSSINMVKDVIASGDDISGVVFSTSNYYRSSYSNGELKRL